MKASVFGTKFIRACLLLMTPVMIAVVAYGIYDVLRDGQMCVALFLLVFVTAWLLLVGAVLREAAVVQLLEDGVSIRFYFKRQFFGWDEIVQAGIAYRPFMKGNPNWFVLLLPDGSPRVAKDKTFFLRNMWKVVRLNDSESVQNYVIQHYGPLDFNMWNGRPENMGE